MALEDLLAAVERDARANIDEVLAEARREAARITGEHAERRREGELASLRRELDLEARARLAAARLRASAEVLEARDRLVRRVLRAAMDQAAAAARSDAFLPVLEDWLTRAVALVGAGGAVVRCDEALAQRARGSIGASVDADIEIDPRIDSGYEVRARDGSVTVDATLAGRITRLARTLAIRIMRLAGTS